MKKYRIKKAEGQKESKAVAQELSVHMNTLEAL